MSRPNGLAHRDCPREQGFWEGNMQNLTSEMLIPPVSLEGIKVVLPKSSPSFRGLVNLPKWLVRAPPRPRFQPLDQKELVFILTGFYHCFTSTRMRAARSPILASNR